MSRTAPACTLQLFRWSPPGVPSRYISVRVISLLAIFGIGILTLLNLVPRPIRNVEQPYLLLPASVEKSSVVDVESLIKEIKRATRHASNGGRTYFTQTARALWHQKNPCRSRRELEPLYLLRRIAKDVEPNSKWKRVFKRYENLHRVCMLSIGGDVDGYFRSKNTSSGCKFLVADLPPRAGLGNKVLSMASGLLYAILTQRVFLIPAETLVPGIMCEPFEGSSWLFDTEHKFTPDHADGKAQFWTGKDQFYNEIDSVLSGKMSDMTSNFYALSPNDLWCQPGTRFFCDTEQLFYNNVPWVYINGCLYYLPKLFAIPSLRPVLEDLFPDRMALTHVLRSSMLPSDGVWRRIDQIYSSYMRNADSRVGIQVRYRDGQKEFNEKHDMINARTLKCALDNHILPKAGEEQLASSEDDSGLSPALSEEKRRTSVYITSLYPSLYDFLSDLYARNPPPMEHVGVFQVTRGKEQHYNDEEDRQALTEVISLSLSDYLFVTPLSTFGGLAQGYGALTPWFIDNRATSEDACVRAQTADTCFQVPDFIYDCKYEPDLHKQWVLSKVPYLKDCLPVDAKLGIQLITEGRS